MIVIIIIAILIIIIVVVVMILLPSNVEVKNGVVKPTSTSPSSSVKPIQSTNTKPLNMLLYVQPPLVAAAIPRKKQVIPRGRR